MTLATPMVRKASTFSIPIAPLSTLCLGGDVFDLLGVPTRDEPFQPVGAHSGSLLPSDISRGIADRGARRDCPRANEITNEPA